jgi:hypothetical protein
MSRAASTCPITARSTPWQGSRAHRRKSLALLVLAHRRQQMLRSTKVRARGRNCRRADHLTRFDIIDVTVEPRNEADLIKLMSNHEIDMQVSPKPPSGVSISGSIVLHTCEVGNSSSRLTSSRFNRHSSSLPLVRQRWCRHPYAGDPREFAACRPSADNGQPSLQRLSFGAAVGRPSHAHSRDPLLDG